MAPVLAGPRDLGSQGPELAASGWEELQGQASGEPEFLALGSLELESRERVWVDFQVWALLESVLPGWAWPVWVCPLVVWPDLVLLESVFLEGWESALQRHMNHPYLAQSIPFHSRTNPGP